MNTVTIDVQLVGLEPGLLMNSPKAMLEQGDEVKTRTKVREAPEVEAARKAYRNGGDELYIPAEALRAMLVDAGKKFKQGRGSYTQAFCGYLWVRPQEIPLGTTEYQIDTRTVVIRGSGRILCSRPWLPEWAADLELEIEDTNELPLEVVKSALELGGRRIGLLDFRPAKGGMFGRFEVGKFEVSSNGNGSG